MSHINLNFKSTVHQNTKSYPAVPQLQDNLSVFSKKEENFEFLIPFFQSSEQNYEFALIHHQQLGLRIIVCDTKYNIHILPPQSLISPLNPHLNALNLIHNIPLANLSNFDFIFDINTRKISIFPKIRAAGKEGAFDAKSWITKGVRNLEKSIQYMQLALNKLVIIKTIEINKENGEPEKDKQGNIKYSEKPVTQTVLPTLQNDLTVKIDPKSGKPMEYPPGDKIYTQQPDPLLRVTNNELKNFSGEVTVATNDRRLIVIRVFNEGANPYAAWFGVLPPQGNMQHALDHALDSLFYKRQGVVNVNDGNLIRNTYNNEVIGRIKSDGSIVEVKEDSKTKEIIETGKIIGKTSPTAESQTAKYSLPNSTDKPFYVREIINPQNGTKEIKVVWYDSPSHILISILEPGALFAAGSVAEQTETIGGAEQIYLIKPNADSSRTIQDYFDQKNNSFTVILSTDDYLHRNDSNRIINAEAARRLEQIEQLVANDGVARTWQSSLFDMNQPFQFA